MNPERTQLVLERLEQLEREYLDQADRAPDEELEILFLEQARQAHLAQHKLRAQLREGRGMSAQ